MKKAKAVQKLINDSDLAIGEICTELDVSRFIVHKWRSGKSNPRRENLNKLARLNNVSLLWLNNTEVLLDGIDNRSKPVENESNNHSLNQIIQNQLDLIEILKKDNNSLKTNLKKFQLTKSIINNHDFSLSRAIDTEKIIKISIPQNGLLGYSKNEFIRLIEQWPLTPILDNKVSKKMQKDEKNRVDLAKNLGISHFDISDHILYKCNNGNKIWGYCIKYYDIELNTMTKYIKFLDNIN
tara:strand:- start:365 stop:1081 length:717 start_codon:yes stop_codon:yes gene_type:complete